MSLVISCNKPKNDKYEQAHCKAHKSVDIIGSKVFIA